MKPLRGVNLGGWLVLEPWITPSLFRGTAAVDEYTYCQQASLEQRQTLTKFRDSFITEADFAWLAEHGVQLLRLPVGYWLFGDAPPFMATKHYVDQAFVWAAKHQLKILLDIHGAPGSQNGEDHSGRIGATAWHKNPANIAATLDFIKRLTATYAQQPAWLGLALLNEPKRRIPQRLLINFYKQAYALVDQANAQSWVVISDGFQPWRWYLAMPRRRYPNLYVDYHHYQLYSPQDKVLSARRQLQLAGAKLGRKVKRMARFHQIIIGEWSLALTSEAMQPHAEAERQQIMRRYADKQLRAFAPAAAWFFWTYKTESANAWSFRNLVAKLHYL